MRQNKLIDTSTTSNLYLNFKENNENDMAAQVFWTIFHSKLAQQLISTVLSLHPLHFPWYIRIFDGWSGADIKCMVHVSLPTMP